jgi:hypothetical protein
MGNGAGSQGPSEEDLLPEYDFRGGVRGKHAEAYRQGFTVRIHRTDGEEFIIPDSHLGVLDRCLANREDDPETGSF